jgi:predicted Zn-dependent peptidase
MKNFCLFVFALFLVSVSNAQYLLVEKYEPKDILESGKTNAVKIPYSKYKLDNGLTLIISEDHNNPLVNINMTYKVGSANDYADRTGMAYMIYTLMRNGTRHLSNGEYQKIINRYGGKIYSTITRDKTAFSSTVPKNLLSTVLWMESDRQAYFLDSLTKEKFDITKLDIIAQMYDSLYHQPYGLTNVLAIKNVYPYAYPYSWPEFGMMDHYQAFQLTDLKKYFLDWYGTNNTILTITGDVKTEEVIALVNQYFGLLTKAPQSQAYVDDLVNRIMMGAGEAFSEPRYVSYKMDISNPLLKIVINTVPRFDADEKALNVIAAILGQGQNSILYNEFVKKGYAIYVNAQSKSYRYNGEFIIDIMAAKDTSLAVIVKRLNKLLNDIVLNRNIYANSDLSQIQITPPPPPTLQPQPKIPTPSKIPTQPNDFQQSNIPPQPFVLPSPEQMRLNESRSADAIFMTASQLKATELFSLESLQNKGLMLAEREIINGKPSEVSPSLVEYDQVNPESFFRLFNRYLVNSPKLYVSFISKDNEKLIAAPDNIKEMELQSILTPTLEQDLSFRYPAKEINKKQPKIKDIQVNAKLDLKTETTPSGMEVRYIKSTDFPVVTINLRMNTFKLKKLLPDIDVPRMITWLYNDWFQTQGYDNPLKSVTLSGSVVKFKQENDFITISVTCPREHLMIAKEGLVQLLYRQDYGLEPISSQFITIAENKSPSGIFIKKNYDDLIEHLSSNQFDTLSKMDTATRTAIIRKKGRAAFTKLLTPQFITVSVNGDVEEGQYRDLFMNLAGWQSYMNQQDVFNGPLFSTDSVNVNELNSPSAGNIFFLPDQNKETAKIMVEYMQLPVEVSSNYYTGDLANYAFGTSSESYLTKNLKAFDYILDIKTRHYYRNKQECYAVVLNVKPEHFADAYNNLMKVLDNFKTYKPDKKEFNNVKAEYLYQYATSYETQSQKEQYCNYLLTNQLSKEIDNNKYVYAKKLKASKISKFWSNAYNPQKQRIIVVGNENLIPDAIISTGNKMVLINKAGTVINY